MVKPTPAFDRVMSRVVKVPGGCWLWTGKAGDRGYGLVVTRRRSEGWKISEPVHRVVYGRLVGEIPEGADLHHVCRVKTCVNPDHLRPVDRQAHYDEHRAERRSQFCKKCGASDWYAFPGGNRRCRACRKRSHAEVVARRRNDSEGDAA